MSGTVEELIVKLKGLPDFIEEAGASAIETNEDNILDLNKAQLQAGVDADGFSLGDYSAYSTMLRKEKGLQTDHIDLRDTGAFYNSQRVNQKGDSFEIVSDDPKWEEDLRPRWPDALGLTTQSEDTLTTDLIENLDKKIDAYL